jgi:hypothetical protein
MTTPQQNRGKVKNYNSTSREWYSAASRGCLRLFLFEMATKWIFKFAFIYRAVKKRGHKGPPF